MKMNTTIGHGCTRINADKAERCEDGFVHIKAGLGNKFIHLIIRAHLCQSVAEDIL